MTLKSIQPLPEPSGREALEARSRRFCALSAQHHTMLKRFVSPLQAREHSRRLAGLRPGLWRGNPSQQALVAELTAWTTAKGQTPLERYARQAKLLDGSEEAAVLAGMQGSVLSFWRVSEPHPVAGWILEDLAWNGTVWMVDERLEQYLAAGGSRCFMSRLFRSEPNQFWMSCSSIVPVPKAVAEMMAGQEGEEAGKVSGSTEHANLSRHSTYATMLYASVLMATR